MLVVGGSIALDTLEGPHGLAPDELGGSALYFGLAAALIAPVLLVAAVGRADEGAVREAVAGRAIDLGGLDVLDAPTFRWRARHVGHGNEDLGHEDSIYDLWQPRIPPGATGWAFAGSMRPSLQVEFLRQARKLPLRASDAMLSYTRSAPVDAERVVAASHWYFANADELVALGGDPEQPQAFREAHDLAGLCVKAGPAGARVVTADEDVHVPALTGRPVADTTGAGDALAAGFLARRLTAPDAGLRDALQHGVACASITIEDVGLRSLRAASAADLGARLREVQAARR